MSTNAMPHSLPSEYRPPCTCRPRDRRPCQETDETFEGLFTETPLAAFDAVTCDRCHGIIRGWHPCPPVTL